MDTNLQKINSFLHEHHVMSLASSTADALSVCNLFYAYDDEKKSFVVASSEDTQHIKNIKENPKIAGSVVLETKTIGKIQGLQFRGSFSLLQDDAMRNLYFKTFPYALAMSPKLWEIKISYFKMTDNRLGFGKKIIWENS